MKHRRHRLTLAYRLLLVFVLAFTTVWPLAGPPTSLGAAPPDAPPTPTPPVSPTPSPPEPGISSQSVTPPSPEDLPPEAEQARARQAMEAVLAKYLRYWGLRYQVASIEAAVEGEWAHGVAQWQSQAKTLNGPIHILARRQPDGVWQALLPGGDGLYLQWLEAVPEGLVPGEEKGRLRAQATEAGALWKPMATPVVPPAVTAMSPGKEGPGEPVEPVPGLAQPTATPTPQAAPAVPPAPSAMPPGKEEPGEFIESVPGLAQPNGSASVPTPTPYTVERLEVLRGRLTDTVTSALNDTPYGIRLLNVDFDGRVLTINLSSEALKLDKNAAFQELLELINLHINQLFEEEGLSEQRSFDYYLMIEGEPLFTSQHRAVVPIGASTIQNKKVVVSPGHGRYENSSGGWPLQRGYWWGIVEDFINIDLVIDLNSKLGASGADTRPARQLNKSSGKHASGYPWWEMDASEYVKSIGAPYDVWNGGFNGTDRDIVSRPRFANWIGADAMVSIHNNGGGGCGTETWYDTSNGYQTQSQKLATLIQSTLIERLRSQWDPNWCNRGVKGSNGGYGGNRIFNGPAVIVELAFMDNQSHNAALQNATFRSIAMSAISDAMVEYFGGGSGTTCPQSGGVILYWNNNYNCDNSQGDTGYRQRSSTGWENISGAFNDQASSLRVPSGWSVRLYEHSDRNGASVCRNGDDSDFAGDYFDGGSVPLNDHVSSFEVFDNTNCSSPQYPVTLYEHPDYNGAWCALTGEGWTNVGNCVPNFDFNDKASSIRIQSGWSARVYEHSDRGGSSRCFTGDDSNFSDNTFENGSPLDNQVSSFEAFHNTSCTPPCSPPSAPNLNSPSNGAKLYPEDDLVFNWHGNASEYQVHWWGGPGGDHYSDWMGGTSWNVGQQWESPNRYYWSVKGRNGSGCEGDWSSTWEFMIGPRAPGNLNASAVSYSQINLSWQDNSSSESDYHIERSPNGSSWQQIATVSGTSYQDTGLNASTTYYYRVRAHRHNDDTYSKYSNTASATTPSCPPPAAPTLVSPANGATLPHDADVTLDWNSSSGATDYYAHLWGGPSIDINSGWIGGTDWHIGQLWPGTYSWQVKARNQCGESGWSSGTFTVENPPIGPLGYDGHTVDDDNTDQSSGDGDGIVECGENIELYVILRNQGSGTATGVNATISTGDPYITWLYNTNSAYPDISGGGTGVNSNDFDFAVAPSTPDGHVIQFDLNVSASNAGPWSDFFSLPVACPQPDLRPYAPSGYPYPVVPSSVQGTHTVNTLYAGQPTYFDWHFINSGGGVAPGTFYVELWVDSARYVRYPQPDFAPGQVGGRDDWMETITTPGWHTVRLTTDPDNTVAESDENNNVWERQFYWTPTAPYADDMENGANGWTAAGLWHQVNASSPYLESHSGSHSWWYGQDSTGNYDTGSANSGDLTSPSIYIPAPGYYLRFWYWYETETQSQNWDQRWVQISVNGGPFNNVLQLYDDPMNWWLQSPAINLSGYAGHTIQVRFHFDTLDDGFNDYRGWYLDDFDISSTPLPSCADSYEPNNTPAQARAIAYGQTMSADICPNGDYDFYKFIGAAGDRVVVDVDAKTNGSLLDSYVFLLDSDGMNVLAENDDEILLEVQDSHLGYQLPHNGTYYIKVRAWDHPSVGGADYFYTVRLLRDNTNPSSAAITSPGNDAWLDPGQETIIVSATDNQSGISHVAFLWHGADWGNSDWIWLGEDWDGRDGWSWDFDTSSLAEQRGGAFYIWAFDWAGNWTSAGAWNLGIDRTPPTASADVSLMYGDAPFLDFYVGWSGSDNLSGIASYDVQYRDGAGGDWTNLLNGTTDTYYRFVGQNGHTYYFRARARDYAGNLSTYASGGGDAQHTVQICAVAADAYESDNSHTTAKAIATNGAGQSHNFHAAGDRDWLKFTAGAGITYTLVTTNTGGHADTAISVYASDGATLLAFNDDDPDRWPASRLEWGATRGGTYYVKVEHWDPYAYGCTTAYALSIAKTGTFEVSEKVFLPIILK